jgi:hypothetical protein
LSEDLVLEAGGRASVPLSELNFHFTTGNRSSTGGVMICSRLDSWRRNSRITLGWFVFVFIGSLMKKFS